MLRMCFSYSTGFSLSVTFSPSSLLDRKKTKMPPRLTVETRCSICKFTNFVTHFPLLTLQRPPLLLCYWVCMSERSTKDDGHSWADGKYSSAFAAAKKNICTFCPEDLSSETVICPQRHQDSCPPAPTNTVTSLVTTPALTCPSK